MRSLRTVLAAVLALAAGAARAEEPRDAARRAAASMLRQLEARPPRPPVATVAVTPLRPGAPARAQELADALAVALGERVKVRAWASLDRAAADRARDGALSGGLALPAIPAVQALVVADAAATADGKVRVQLRLVAVPGGAALAAESVTLDAGPAAASPAANASPAASAPSPPPAPPARGAVESGSVEVAMRRMADTLAAGFARLPGNARYRRLAVLDFGETGDEAKRREMGRVVSAELATNLRRDHGLLLVERARLGAVLGELKLAQMGLTDAKQAPDIGHLADAQALVLGTVAETGDRYLVTARIVSADGAETLAAASEAIPAASLVALSSDAVVLRTRKDALFRSMVMPGWGQVYNRQPGKAAIAVGLEAAALGTALAFHLVGTKAEQEYQRKATADDLGSDPTATARALREDAEDAYRWRNAALWTALGVWAVNVADAWYSGVDGEAMLTVAPQPGGAALAFTARF